MSIRHQPGYLPWDKTGNRLLVQSKLGQNKPTNYEIPQQNFIYGQTTYMDPQKANDIMYRWKYHNSSDNKNFNKTKDLITTNKQALRNLITTAPGNFDFRKTNTFYKPVKQGTTHIKIKLPDQNFTYGKPGQLEDPVKLLLANDYGQTDEVLRHTIYTTFMSKGQQPKRKLSCHITKNHHLVKEATAKRRYMFQQVRRDKLKQEWKISRFNDVKAKIDTNNKAAAFNKKKGQEQNVENKQNGGEDANKSSGYQKLMEVLKN